MSVELTYPLAANDLGTLVLLALVSTETSLAPGQPPPGTSRSDRSAFLVLEGRIGVLGSDAQARSYVPGDWLWCNGSSTPDWQVAEPTRLLEVPHQFLDAQSVPDAEHGPGDSRPQRVRLNVAADPAGLCRHVGSIGLVRLEGGDTLCRQGDPADEAFILLQGSLEVFVGQSGRERLVRTLYPQAVVGEIALLSNGPRSATVRALRDSELIRIPADRCSELLIAHQHIALALTRMLAERLRSTTHVPSTVKTAKSIGIMAAGAGADIRMFAHELCRALSTFGASLVLDRAAADAALAGFPSGLNDPSGTSHVIGWLSRCESNYRYVVYLCDDTLTPWTERALRQVDLLLAVGNGETNPAPNSVEQAIASGAVKCGARQELVLLHHGSTPCPAGTGAWLNARNVAAHHHLRAARWADLPRLVRAICGRSVGLVLSGGGARGFAHIGVLKALAERGIDVDVIGGTSMGAVIAAEAALRWDIDLMIERNRREFMDSPVWGDLTFPYAAVLKGAGTVNLLRNLFGSCAIEDLWLPYFCTSTNLSRAELMVHDRGPVWLWVRSSSSVPGIGPPVVVDGDLLIDGGVLNNLPADVMRSRCSGHVLAVDVSPKVEMTTAKTMRAEMSGWAELARRLNPWSTVPAVPSVFEILTRTASISSRYLKQQVRESADLLLNPPTEAIGVLDWGAIEQAVEIGYRHALPRIEQWMASKEVSA